MLQPPFQPSSIGRSRPPPRCLDAVLSPPPPPPLSLFPGCRMRDDVLGTIPELARGMANEIANTVSGLRVPCVYRRPCCLCSFSLFRLVCRPPMPSYLAIYIYMDGLPPPLRVLMPLQVSWIDFVERIVSIFGGKDFVRLFFSKIQRSKMLEIFYVFTLKMDGM